MQHIRKRLEKVCSINIPVLIQGDPGTGKEILAHWIHAHSPWRDGSFVKVNCAAIPGMLLESELFGYQKGAFTGAVTSKPGRAELAQGGTLFLDEISSLDPVLQAKLLQVLQDGRFSRLGDEEERRLDARVICTSNLRIEEAVRLGHFRKDLYYRIDVFHVDLVPLSDRRKDIPQIAKYLFDELCKRYQRDVPPISSRMLEALQLRDFNGNVRELENRIAAYVLLGLEETPEEIAALRQHLATKSAIQQDGVIPLKQVAEKACREVGREAILQALQANRWNRRRAAEDLKISYRALLYKIREAGVPPKQSNRQILGAGGTPTSSAE
jgi:transcriptional regulator with PAS, ATPase and Fis domain